MFVPGTIIGCLLASAIPDRVGRKGTFLLAAIACGVGVAVQAAGPPAVVFVIARLVHGIGLGLISIVTPVYLVEASSGTTRGITVATQLALVLVVVAGAVIAPESPTILLRRGKVNETEQSIITLRNLQPGSIELDTAMQEIRNWLAEQALAGTANMVECFRGTNLRRTLIGIGMAIMTIATGITFWFSYGTTFFEAVGLDDAYLVSLVLAITNCVFTAPSIVLVEKVGRRPLMFIGGAVMAFSELLTAVIHTISPGSRTAANMLLVGSILFIAGYASSWGPTGWLLMAEPYSARLRTHSTTLSMMVYWITTWAVGFVTPYVVDETAADLGVDMLFNQKVPAWRSVSWKKKLRTVDGIEPSKEEISEMIVTAKSEA
ncbi:monosaccharide transporter [Lasiodiplodia theobromae]|nr:monosaccharide transporter [Lasiodiplodia theobromae]